MPYAEGRTYYDADSHIMELPDFLRDHADPALRDRMPPISTTSGGVLGKQGAETIARGRHSDGHKHHSDKNSDHVTHR